MPSACPMSLLWADGLCHQPSGLDGWGRLCCGLMRSNSIVWAQMGGNGCTKGLEKLFQTTWWMEAWSLEAVLSWCGAVWPGWGQDLHARLMGGWMQTSTARFLRMSSRGFFSIMTNPPMVSSSNKTMTPSVSVCLISWIKYFIEVNVDNMLAVPLGTEGTEMRSD